MCRVLPLIVCHEYMFVHVCENVRYTKVRFLPGIFCYVSYTSVCVFNTTVRELKIWGQYKINTNTNLYKTEWQIEKTKMLITTQPKNNLAVGLK